MGALLLSRPAPQSPHIPVTNSATEVEHVEDNVENNNDLEQVKIDVVGGQAEVFRDGKSIGTTPIELNENSGTQVSLTLRREGYREMDLNFTVTNRKKNYSYLMEKS